MFKVYAFNDHDEKLKVFSCDSLSECCAVVQSLYYGSDLDFKIYDPSDELIVSFYKSVTK